MAESQSDYMTVKGTLSGQGGGFNIEVSIGPHGRHPKKTKYELDSVEKDLPADLKLTDNLVAELSARGKENLVSQLASGIPQEQSFRLENNNGFIRWELKNENGLDPLRRFFVAVKKFNRESGKTETIKQFVLEAKVDTSTRNEDTAGRCHNMNAFELPVGSQTTKGLENTKRQEEEDTTRQLKQKIQELEKQLRETQNNLKGTEDHLVAAISQLEQENRELKDQLRQNVDESREKEARLTDTIRQIKHEICLIQTELQETKAKVQSEHDRFNQIPPSDN